LEAELIRFFPDEILIPHCIRPQEFQAYFKRLGYFTTVVHDNDEQISENNAAAWIKKQFTQPTCAQIESDDAMRQALFYFYAYMSKHQRSSLDQFSTIFFYKPDDFLIMDAATQRNLELVKNLQDGSSKNTLFSVMDRARTAMGSRMIKKWLLRPLVKKEAIVQRQEVIALCCSDIAWVSILEQLLSCVGDCERIVGRIALQRASLMDYSALVQILQVIPQFKSSMEAYKDVFLMRVIAEHLGEFHALSELLVRALHDEPSADMIIKLGFDAQLDQMRTLVNNSNERIADLEATEQKLTGISSLKIRYNAVCGYYIEITNANLSAVPERYRRLQTLVGRERFITSELQQLQHGIESARKDIATHEQTLFDGIKRAVAVHISALRKSAHAIAHIDALLSFARLAYDNGYVCPQLNDNRDIIIVKGRHPMVEQALSHTFIPNDTMLTDEQSLWIITGPNMGGKSTYLRQVALMAVMTHVGSFVPAQTANIALLDRIFTRIGASDNVAEGKSTFLVEMEETAMICTESTEKSLVILDEVGRGTSTFDGLAIAQAVVEYIFTTIGARCLFATHYHELTNLPHFYPGIAVYQAASKKTDYGILFLYTIIRGIADGSFGIEVAKLAHLPPKVIARSTALVESFAHESAVTVVGAVKNMADQHEFYGEIEALKVENKRLLAEQKKSKKIMAALQEIDFDTLSPKKAFDLLWECKES